jgi:hypothetical protein
MKYKIKNNSKLTLQSIGLDRDLIFGTKLTIWRSKRWWGRIAEHTKSHRPRIRSIGVKKKSIIIKAKILII